MGHSPKRLHGDGPCYLISDLGQFDFANRRLRLITYHPGTTPTQIQARTGFELELSPDLHETPAPTGAELRLLREVIDPMGIRRLETVSGSTRRDMLHEILEREMGHAGPTPLQ
jgi:hypothetical protein